MRTKGRGQKIRQVCGHHLYVPPQQPLGIACKIGCQRPTMSALILAKYILRQGLVDPDSNESQVDHCHPSRQYAIFGSCSNTNLRSRLSMTLAGIRQFLLPRLMQLALIQQKRLLQLCNHRSRCYSWQRGERTDEKGPKGIIPHCTAKCGGGVPTRSARSEGRRAR